MLMRVSPAACLLLLPCVCIVLLCYIPAPAPGCAAFSSVLSQHLRSKRVNHPVSYSVPIVLRSEIIFF